MSDGSRTSVTDDRRACVVPLDRLTAADRPRVGGKAANLGELLRAALPVPAGFCLTTAAFRQFLDASGMADRICAELKDADPARLEHVREAATRVRACLAAVPVPAEVAEEIINAWQAMWPGRPDVAMAVRSSATAEDLPGASFAGQQDTYLNVRGREALLKAVRDCWLSLFNERAIVYRASNNIDHRGVAMAVVVQEFVPADAAGVLFTVDPAGPGPERERRIVIEAVHGLGEVLVAGRASPDRTVLDRQNLAVLERHIGHQTVMAVPADAGGMREEPLPLDRIGQSCLTEQQARELAELGLRVERIFGTPQDIEWALRDGRLWMLQARPITTLARATCGPPASATDRTVWSNVNVGEVLPGVLTPMTWSVMRRMIEVLFAPLLKRLGIDLLREQWLALIAGRVYANLSVFARFVGSLPGPSRMNLSEAFGGYGVPSADLTRILSEPDPRGRWHHGLALLLRMPILLTWVLGHLSLRRGQAVMAKYGRKVDKLVDVDFTRMSDQDVGRFIGTILRGLYDESDGVVYRAVAYAGVGMTFTSGLFRVTRRWLDDQHGALTNRLISGAGGMASAESALDLWRLADWARQRPTLATLLTDCPDYAALNEQLSKIDDGREFLRLWAEWSTRHGHHTYGEIDVSRPRWSETPDYVLTLLRTYLATPEEDGPLALRRRQEAERGKLLAECRARLGPLRRRVFDSLLRRSRGGLVIRENLKSEAVRVIAALRRALLEVGRRLARQGVLRERDDIFFLELGEIEPLLAAPNCADTQARIAARRVEFARNQNITPPAVIVGRFDPDRAAVAPEYLVSADAGANTLRGLAVSAGVATGPARVILRPDGSETVQPGEILVAPFTDPGWTPYFLTAAAIVVDMGGMLSHGSIVAREYGIPAVVNVGPATRLIQTGQLIRVDGDHGVVTIIGTQESPAGGMSAALSGNAAPRGEHGREDAAMPPNRRLNGGEHAG